MIAGAFSGKDDKTFKDFENLYECFSFCKKDAKKHLGEEND